MTTGKDMGSEERSFGVEDVKDGSVEAGQKPQTSMDFSIKASCELDRSCSDSDPEQSCCE